MRDEGQEEERKWQKGKEEKRGEFCARSARVASRREEGGKVAGGWRLGDEKGGGNPRRPLKIFNARSTQKH